MERQTTIHAEVDKATKLAVRQMAKDMRVSVSDVVRWALHDYIGNRKNESARQEKKP